MPGTDLAQPLRQDAGGDNSRNRELTCREEAADIAIVGAARVVDTISFTGALTLILLDYALAADAEGNGLLWALRAFLLLFVAKLLGSITYDAVDRHRTRKFQRIESQLQEASQQALTSIVVTPSAEASGGLFEDVDLGDYVPPPSPSVGAASDQQALVATNEVVATDTTKRRYLLDPRTSYLASLGAQMAETGASWLSLWMRLLPALSSDVTSFLPGVVTGTVFAVPSVILEAQVARMGGHLAISDPRKPLTLTQRILHTVAPAFAAVPLAANAIPAIVAQFEILYADGRGLDPGTNFTIAVTGAGANVIFLSSMLMAMTCKKMSSENANKVLAGHYAASLALLSFAITSNLVFLGIGVLGNNGAPYVIPFWLRVVMQAISAVLAVGLTYALTKQRNEVLSNPAKRIEFADLVAKKSALFGSGPTLPATAAGVGYMPPRAGQPPLAIEWQGDQAATARVTR